MGSLEAGIERVVPTVKFNISSKGDIEETETHEYGAGICERVQFVDVGYQEHE